MADAPLDLDEFAKALRKVSATLADCSEATKKAIAKLLAEAYGNDGE